LLFDIERPFLSALDTHDARTSFPAPLDLLRNIQTSHNKQNACLNGLKHAT
jgi:hypothetical protein